MELPQPQTQTQPQRPRRSLGTPLSVLLHIDGITQQTWEEAMCFEPESEPGPQPQPEPEPQPQLQPQI
jgi:hypothetical protein